ncbi:adenosylcobinamide amidohydrolase [Dehalogenimonas etheniformans]|uniref:Cobalamin biosynthesis protein CbiZ n=1 Tax=Dehalogenimonas etheniformans TaxID=1536648 RepID=A0A2P5PA82_9CHLR|nr:adenosylcobinamide amidohydrolase [Dehalogenimonas etheniformans]PPD59190.1 cobalamin biosynthesis protein CbiZ [Dehalogenimonas etheniformans]QNT75767.1 adenosylcobinamide amidohydrolase [Dehalogenimonas etheniformans]
MIRLIDKREIYKCHGVIADFVDYQTDDEKANLIALRFSEPRPSLSGDNGYSFPKLVCNCYLPKSLCDYLHHINCDFNDHLRQIALQLANIYDVNLEDISLISTGVDMNEMEYAEETFGDFWVVAWVTAGFKHNALRVGVDTAHGIEIGGKFTECGTINIILSTNASLSLATMASSFITITEAKGIALQDLMIHSSFNPRLQATGTGTDQIIVVSGHDFPCRYVGGHTKLGELIAKAVTRACKMACSRQLAKNPHYHTELEPDPL